MKPLKTNLEPSKLTWSWTGWLWGVQVVTGDSQEEVMIFRYRQTELHHNIYIAIIIVIIGAISGIRVSENCTQTPNSRLASAER